MENKRIYYHGSPLKNLTELKSGSWVSSDRNIAYQMGRYYKSTGKKWYDDDLVVPYDFKGAPLFKNGKIPNGEPTIYIVENPKLDLLNNPYEHRLIGNHRAIKENSK